MAVLNIGPFLDFQVGALQACVLAQRGYEVHLYEGRDGKPVAEFIFGMFESLQ